jgi:hypothetical protein
LAAPGRHARDPVQVLTFVLTLWTDDSVLAARADDAGIDRVGVDLEVLRKAERQRGLGTWISPHAVDALPALRAALSRSQLFARTNPVHPGTRDEVERLLAAGVEVLMLPMFSTAREVEEFTAAVDGRAEVVLLLERVEAAEAIDEILEVEDVNEVHIGINDFTLDLGLPNRFLALTHDLTAVVAERVHRAGKRFGIGGIGRVDDPRLPVESDLIYAQYARLGATAALVSRAFLGPDAEQVDLRAEVARARERLASWFARSDDELLSARERLTEAALRAERW